MQITYPNKILSNLRPWWEFLLNFRFHYDSHTSLCASDCREVTGRKRDTASFVHSFTFWELLAYFGQNGCWDAGLLRSSLNCNSTHWLTKPSLYHVTKESGRGKLAISQAISIREPSRTCSSPAPRDRNTEGSESKQGISVDDGNKPQP